MGIKRLGRKRLAAIEKLGILKDVKTSDVMKDAVVSATQHREGQKLTTDIVLDLGATSAALKTRAVAADDPIGNGSGASYIAQITDAVFGHVVSVQAICLEGASDGTLTDFDLIIAGDGVDDTDPSSGNAGALGTDPQNITSLVANGFATTGQDNLVSVGNGDFNAKALSNKYLYISAGNKTDQRASCEIDCSGVTDVSKLVSGMNAIRLLAADGATAKSFVFTSPDKGWDKTATANEVNIGGTGATSAAASNMDNAKKLAFAISTAIEGTAGFTTNAASRNNAGGAAASNETKITVTRNNTTPTTTGNTANVLVDAYEASGITITDFSGGIGTAGQAISSGKLLIRIEGFVDFDDL